MTPTVAPSTGTILIHMVDGARQPFPPNIDTLIRVIDGARRQKVTQWVEGSNVRVPGLPIAGSPDDNYTVFAHAKGYNDAGVFPVPLRRGANVDAPLMLTPKDCEFHFLPWDQLQQQAPATLRQLLANGVSAADAQARYAGARENSNLELGALLTIGAAIDAIALNDGKSPLTYYWEVAWELCAQDRFWAWVDADLAGRIKELSDLHAFAEEADAAHWHPGIQKAGYNIGKATRSWKQTRFDVCNVQLTFHEDDKDTRTAPDGRQVKCVIVEPDIDYFKDLASHALGEVIPNLLSGGLTDPRVVYAMRWMATQQEGLPEFAPPCTLE